MEDVGSLPGGACHTVHCRQLVRVCRRPGYGTWQRFAVPCLQHPHCTSSTTMMSLNIYNLSFLSFPNSPTPHAKDMKHENLMFSADGSRCAAYDFQYTGCSYGMRDVVYLFTSSVRSDQLARYEQDYLAHYRECLAKELTQLGRAEAAVRYDNAVMTKHLELAVLDYVRFMAGWGMWGSGLDWAVSRARVALPRVEQLLE